MRDKKRVFKIISQVEYKSLESYFEEMAAKGWLIEKFGFGMTFKRIEPQQLTFNVAIISPKTMLDWPDNETTMTYDEYCEDAGWQLAATSQIYRIYYHSAEVESTPIYTEEEDVYKAVRSNFFKSDFIMIFLPLLYLGNLWMNLSNKRFDMFTSNISIFNLLMPFFLIIIFWMISIPSLFWVLVNKHRLSEGHQLFYYSPRWVKNKNRFMVGFMAVYFISLLYALFYDPFNNYSVGFIVAALLPVTVLLGIMYLYNRYIKKQTYPLPVKIGILVLVWFVFMGITIGGMITIIGFDFFEGEKSGPIVPEVDRLTLGELGYDGHSETDWWYVESSLFVPLSYEYDESLEINGDEVYIHVEYLKNRTEGLANWSVQTALERENDNYMEELTYNPELANYIIEVEVENPYDALIYNLSESGRKVLIVRGNEVYIVRSSEVFQRDMIDKTLKGLFNR